jgi:hypothetical protein
MEVMGYLLVVGPVALTAFPRYLVAVLECRGLGVTGQTVNIIVRCRSISCFINQRKRMGLTIFRAVALKAKISGLLHGPGIIAGNGQVTLQALAIFV